MSHHRLKLLQLQNSSPVVPLKVGMGSAQGWVWIGRVDVLAELGRISGLVTDGVAGDNGLHGLLPVRMFAGQRDNRVNKAQRVEHAYDDADGLEHSSPLLVGGWGVGCSACAQNRPVHIWPQFLAANLTSSRAFNRWAMLRWHTPIGVEPWPYPAPVINPDRQTKCCLAAKNFSCAEERSLFGVDICVHCFSLLAVDIAVNGE